MGPSRLSFGAAQWHLAQAIGLSGHCRHHRLLADRGLQLPADPIVYCDYRRSRPRHLGADLVHLAGTKTPQSNLIGALAGSEDYGTRHRLQLAQCRSLYIDKELKEL